MGLPLPSPVILVSHCQMGQASGRRVPFILPRLKRENASHSKTQLKEALALRERVNRNTREQAPHYRGNPSTLVVTVMRASERARGMAKRVFRLWYNHQAGTGHMRAPRSAPPKTTQGANSGTQSLPMRANIRPRPPSRSHNAKHLAPHPTAQTVQASLQQECKTRNVHLPSTWSDPAYTNAGFGSRHAVRQHVYQLSTCWRCSTSLLHAPHLAPTTLPDQAPCLVLLGRQAS